MLLVAELRLWIKMLGMQRQPLDQSGFIPMLITILLVVGALIYVAYTRVLHANN
jgi:hypothetical protein